MNSRFRLFLLILAAAALYLIGNGSVALWDRDEPRYAMASRYMLQTSDWVVPRMGWGLHPETPRTAKPPLIYWCQAAAMKFLGPTVFAARLPSSIAMILTLILLAIVLRKHFPQHAFWTVLIFATSVLTIVAAKMCVIDSIQLLWILICEMCCYAIWRGHFTWPIALILAIAMGLAELAKGPVIFGVIATTVIALLLLQFFSANKEWGVTLREAQKRSYGLKIFALILINLAIVIPWLILVHQRSPEFLSRIIGHDLLQRMHEPLEGHKGPPGFYLLTIFGTFYPWSLFLPLLIINAWKHRDEPPIRFALAATIGPWLMFECISTKMVHYVLPIFPPLAFLLADAIVRALRQMQNDECRMQNENQKSELNSSFCIHHSAFLLLPRWSISLWSLLTTAIATALILPDRHFLQPPLWPAILMVLAGLIYAITVLNFFWKQKIPAAITSMGIGFLIFIILLFTFYLPTATFLRISPTIADSLNQNRAPDARMYGYEEESLAFYDQGRIDSLSASTLHSPISAWPPYLVITSDLFDKLPASIKSHYHLVAIADGMNYSKSIKPLSVLLVTTMTHYTSMDFHYWLMPYPPFSAKP